MLVALAPGSFEVFVYFGLQCLGKHPTRSLAGDLVKVEQVLFAALFVLV